MRSRSHFTGVWLNDAEYRQLMQLCQSSGLSASAMIRKCILGETVKPRPPDLSLIHISEPTRPY